MVGPAAPVVTLGDLEYMDRALFWAERGRGHRPCGVRQAATSLAGTMSSGPGQRTSLTSPAANRHAHGVRAEVDAIGVGVGTILADDPLLTARGVYRERPLVRVVFDRRLR